MILNISVITYETPILNTRNKMRLEQIRIDGGTQARAKMNEDTVRTYAEALKDGVEFPPVVVFHDGKDHWLADGFNRYYAHQSIKRTEIEADVRRGNILDAKLYACGANATHGQPRTIADKRNSVLLVLNEAAWKGMSEREVARACNVSHTYVQIVKKSLATLPQAESSPKAEKKQIPKQEVPEYDPSDDMRETITALNEELEKATRAAAAGVLADGMENAQEIMDRQAEEIKTLQAELDGLKSTRDTMMVEIKELKKQCAYYQKKMKEIAK
jgi:hypothetical protein